MQSCESLLSNVTSSWKWPKANSPTFSFCSYRPLLFSTSNFNLSTKIAWPNFRFPAVQAKNDLVGCKSHVLHRQVQNFASPFQRALWSFCRRVLSYRLLWNAKDKKVTDWFITLANSLPRNMLPLSVRMLRSYYADQAWRRSVFTDSSVLTRWYTQRKHQLLKEDPISNKRQIHRHTVPDSSWRYLSNVISVTNFSQVRI